MKKIKEGVSKRETTRLVAVMIYYLLENNDNTKEEVIDYIFNTPLLQEEIGIDINNTDRDFLNTLLDGVILNKAKIIEHVENVIINNKISSNFSDSLIFSILYLGTFELMSKVLDKPIIVSQYVNIASDFFDNKQEISIVNAILDSINIT